MDTEAVLNWVFTGTGTLMGGIALYLHYRHYLGDRTSFELDRHRITYYVVTPEMLAARRPLGTQAGKAGDPGVWLNFTGRVVNTGARDGAVRSIRVIATEVASHDVGKCYPFPQNLLAISVDAGKARDVGFLYQLTEDYRSGASLPKQLPCEIVLRDQKNREYRFAYEAVRDKPQVPLVQDRSH